MKIETPWSTKVIELLPISPKSKFLLWLWIMMDRFTFFAAGLGTAMLLHWLVK